MMNHGNGDQKRHVQVKFTIHDRTFIRMQVGAFKILVDHSPNLVLDVYQ